MKKLISTKKGKIILFSSLAIVFIALAIFIGMYQKQAQEKQKQIDNQIVQIEKIATDFDKEEKYDMKLDALKSIISKYDEYKNGKSVYSEVSDKYEESIKNFKKYFIESYDKTITKNTLEDVDKIDDKVLLSDSKSALETLLKTINDEKDIVSNDEEVKKYETKINTLVDSYSKRISAIEETEKKAEEERLAKEEEERQAQAAAQNSQQSSGNSGGNAGASNSGNSGGSTNTPSTPNSGGGNSGRPWNYGFKWTINGETGERTWINPQTNDVYDDNGNWLFNVSSPIM